MAFENHFKPLIDLLQSSNENLIIHACNSKPREHNICIFENKNFQSNVILED